MACGSGSSQADPPPRRSVEATQELAHVELDLAEGLGANRVAGPGLEDRLVVSVDTTGSRIPSRVVWSSFARVVVHLVFDRSWITALGLAGRTYEAL